MGKANSIRMDERNVYSLSGKAYARTPPRNRNHVRERRLPYVKRVGAGGRFYYYFTGPDRACLNRLPDVEDVAFDNAYLKQLAMLEGGSAPDYQAPVRSSVYFIGCSAAIKIGVTVKLEARLATLRSHSPLPLSLMASIEGGSTVEREYHRRFAAHRLHGEWFEPHPDILAEIARLTHPQEEG